MSTFELHFPNPDAGFDQTYLYPHNLLLDVAYDGGIVGLGLLLIALGLTFRSGIQANPRDPAAIYLLGFMVFAFLSTLVAGDVYDSRMLWLTGFAMVNRPGRA